MEAEDGPWDGSNAYDDLDRKARMMIAQMTGGRAPMALWSAMADWSVNLAIAPGKQMKLAGQALEAAARAVAAFLACDTASGGTGTVTHIDGGRHART